MTLEPRAVLIDDSTEDQKHAERLTKAGLACDLVALRPSSDDVVAEVIERVEAGRCDLVIIDYRLDAEPQSSFGSRAAYRGASLAAGIRERLPSLPLVLTTTEEWYDSQLSESPQLKGLFDAVVLKRRLASRHERLGVVVELTSIAKAFSAVEQSGPSDWHQLFELLGVSADSIGDFDGEQFPKGTAAIVRWIQGELLSISGPTVDDHDAAAVMGISVSSFRRDDVAQYCQGARYRGVLSDVRSRWWRRELEALGRAAAESVDVSSGDSRAAAVAAAIGVTGKQVRSAKCVWCGETDVARACTVCREPVDPGHGLTSSQARPAWGARAFVCFRCIQTGRADGIPFQRGTDAVLEALRSGQLSSPRDGS